MKLLITGATGFIGSNFAKHVMAAGWWVRAATRDARTPSGCNDSVVVGELSRSTDWSAAVAGIDVVVHLAGIAHLVRKREQRLAKFEEVNAEATRRLAQAAAAAGVRRFLYVSTAKVNGEFSVKPFHENDLPAPADRYAASKFRGEQVVQEIASTTAMQFAIVRSPLVYGPGVRGNFLSLLRIVERGLPLPFGTIKNRRSYIASKNIADALMFVTVNPEAANQVLFVSDGEDVSTPELIRRIAVSLGKKPRLFSVPLPLLRAGATAIGRQHAFLKLITSFQVDISRIRTLGWQPVTQMDEALWETGVWYKSAQ